MLSNQEDLEKELVLELSGVSLKFPTKTFRSTTLREWFSSRGRHPLDGTLSGTEKDLIVANQISAKVHTGDRIGIVGKNGSGKSTLCRLISGIYRPDSGMIRYQGQLRLVLDTSLGLFPDLTGRENLEILSRFLFTDEGDRRQALEDALNWSQIGWQLDAPIRTYSKGMQARLVLSLVSGSPSDILVLDEVFDGADQFFTERTLPRFKKSIDESGAVLFVSHDARHLSSFCNRLWVLEKGHLVFDGNVTEGLDFYNQLGRKDECVS